jgi:hypothetical protein
LTHFARVPLDSEFQIASRSDIRDARCTVAIERGNWGQRDCGNSALESIQLKEILIGSLKAF